MIDVAVLGILILLATAMVAYSLWPARERDEEAASRRANGLAKADDEAAIRRKARDSTGVRVLERAAPLLSRPVMPRNDAEGYTLKSKLMNAGFRQESAPMLFLASKTALAIVGGIIGTMYAASVGKPTAQVLSSAALGAGLGFMLPNGWLWLTVKRRCEAIQHGLPDCLDLMVVSVESGLGLDAAMQRVGDEMRLAYPELSEELQVASIETQMGVPRAEALMRMAERTGVQEMRALVVVIAQAEKLGTSVAKALRNQADSLRTKRRQKAEERAQKTAVKLMLPLILFIFPAMLIVLGGPAALKLMEVMSSGGSLSGGK